jgi:hypothetical protein
MLMAIPANREGKPTHRESLPSPGCQPRRRDWGNSSTSPMTPANPGRPALTPTDKLLAMASGAWVTQMDPCGRRAGGGDQRAGGEQDGATLAAACGANAESFCRLLRALASLGLFQEITPRQFALTPLAELLRSDHPSGLRQFARILGEEHNLSWDDLLHGVPTGANAYRHRYGCSVFEWSLKRLQRAEIFNTAMGDVSRRATPPSPASGSLSTCRDDLRCAAIR